MTSPPMTHPTQRLTSVMTFSSQANRDELAGENGEGSDPQEAGDDGSHDLAVPMFQ